MGRGQSLDWGREDGVVELWEGVTNDTAVD